MRRWLAWLLFTFLVLGPCRSASHESSRVVATPKKKRLAAPKRRSSAPSYFIPQGPRGSRLRLVRLRPKQSVPQAIQAYGASAGIPPSYFSLRDGRLAGFAAVNGRVIDHFPLEASRTDRVLVLLRRKPQRNHYNLWYVRPTAVYKAARGKLVTLAVIKRLGIDLKKFDVVTMHHDRCVAPNLMRERSGMIVTARRVKLFSWQKQRRTLRQTRGIVPPRATIFFGDGGDTVARPTVRDPKLALIAWP